MPLYIEEEPQGVELSYNEAPRGNPSKVYVRLSWVLSNEPKKLGIRWRNRHGWVYVEQEGSSWTLTGTRPSQKVVTSSDMVGFSEADSYARARTQSKLSKGINMKTKALYIGGPHKAVKASPVVKMGSKPKAGFYFKIDTALVAQLKPTSLVVVDDGELTVCRVTDIYDLNLGDPQSLKAFKDVLGWVVGVIDTTDHEARILATDRRAVILEQLEARKAAVDELAIFKALAASDPDAAKLLEELQTLGG